MTATNKELEAMRDDLRRGILRPQWGPDVFAALIQELLETRAQYKRLQAQLMKAQPNLL